MSIFETFDKGLQEVGNINIYIGYITGSIFLIIALILFIIYMNLQTVDYVDIIDDGQGCTEKIIRIEKNGNKITNYECSGFIVKDKYDKSHVIPTFRTSGLYNITDKLPVFTDKNTGQLLFFDTGIYNITLLSSIGCFFIGAITIGINFALSKSATGRRTSGVLGINKLLSQD